MYSCGHFCSLLKTSTHQGICILYIFMIFICGVLCEEVDGSILTMQTYYVYLSLINNIAHHCISHNNTTVWVVDLQNSIILSVNVPHNTI